MKVWMVYITVKERTAGSPRTIARWLDSQWAEEKSALDRKAEVESSMQHFDCYRSPGCDSGSSANIVIGSVVDAGLVNPAEAPHAK